MTQKDKTKIEDKRKQYEYRKGYDAGYKTGLNKATEILAQKAKLETNPRIVIQINDNEWKKKIEKIVKNATDVDFGTTDYDMIGISIIKLL